MIVAIPAELLVNKKLFFKGAASSFDEYSWCGLALLPTNGLSSPTRILLVIIYAV
jgi:hypothetical protein